MFRLQPSIKFKAILLCHKIQKAIVLNIGTVDPRKVVVAIAIHLENRFTRTV
jgi:hypothetical protein